VQRYLNKISGPLLDRIDIHVEVTPISFNELANSKPSEGSKEIRERVGAARTIQKNRYLLRNGIHCNAQMSMKEFEIYCKIDEAGSHLLKTAMDKMGLSARAYDRILKVARTIADLESAEKIEATHIAEAIQYRSLDRTNWALN
jgi:magnesium chelatase family protein